MPKSASGTCSQHTELLSLCSSSHKPAHRGVATANKSVLLLAASSVQFATLTCVTTWQEGLLGMLEDAAQLTSVRHSFSGRSGQSAGCI